MKREKRLTKREQKALKGPRPGAATAHEQEHIHCVACGRHLAPAEFTGSPATATRLRCRGWAHRRKLLSRRRRTLRPTLRCMKGKN